MSSQLYIDPNSLVEEKLPWPFDFDSYEEELAFKEQVAIWQKEYGSIYTTEINEVFFIFRELTRGEWKQIEETYEEDDERKEQVCKVAVLYPIIEDYSISLFAGVPELLAMSICTESCLTEDTTKQETLKRKWMYMVENDVNYQIPLMIKEAFQEIPLLEIEAWPMTKLVEYYAKARYVLERYRGIEFKD
jgi:hypothetical protein